MVDLLAACKFEMKDQLELKSSKLKDILDYLNLENKDDITIKEIFDMGKGL